MPKFVIEERFPMQASCRRSKLRTISQTSCGVLREMGPQIQWLQKLRHRRQDLLHLHCPSRMKMQFAEACPAGRVSGPTGFSAHSNGDLTPHGGVTAEIARRPSGSLLCQGTFPPPAVSPWVVVCGEVGAGLHAGWFVTPKRA